MARAYPRTLFGSQLEIDEKFSSFLIDFCNSSSLISSGTNVNVYCVEYNEKQYVLKELFPVGLREKRILSRSLTAPQKVAIKWTPQAFIEWQKAKRRFLTAYRINEKLQKTNGLSDFIVPVHFCMRKNGTLYSVSMMPPGIPLDKTVALAPECLLLICARIADRTELIHRLGWLLVDIKASNYIIYDSFGNSTVRMTDFDSAVPIVRIRSTRKFMCSNETAPPEMLRGDNRYVGTHSDVYSIASMLTMMLAQKPINQHMETFFEERIKQRLAYWKPASVKALTKVLSLALQTDPHRRIKTCKTLSDSLLSVCKMEGLDNASLFF